jgi:hypothetical protein
VRSPEHVCVGVVAGQVVRDAPGEASHEVRQPLCALRCQAPVCAAGRVREGPAEGIPIVCSAQCRLQGVPGGLRGCFCAAERLIQLLCVLQRASPEGCLPCIKGAPGYLNLLR